MVARLGDLGASQQWLLAGAGRPARVTDAPYRRRVPGAGAAALRCTESGLVPVDLARHVLLAGRSARIGLRAL